jgi:hypothetical protein
MTTNTSTINGDGNIALQNIIGNITIVMGPDLPIEVKQQKERMKVTLTELANTISIIDGKINAAQKPEPFSPPEGDANYDAIKWRPLKQALSHQGCVLFIGPEISVNSQGKSLHQEFYLELDKDYDEIEYMEQEGYFSPDSEAIIRYDIQDFYQKVFPKKNITGRKILEQLAQVPFSLIISICPDDTVHRVFEDYDLGHQFLEYDGTKQEAEPMTPEKPVIYNILGNAASNDGYIFTHEKFYNYLNKIFIPSEIKKKIQDATHYVFIGFDFNKWYNRLLLFILDFGQKKSGAHRMTIGRKDVKEDIEKFIAKQFNITFIDNDYNKFIEWLIYNVNEQELLRNLNQYFVQNSILKLTSVSSKVVLENDLDELRKMETQIGEIGKRIMNFNNKITN